ncbi:uncharacterized protein LOC101739891 isoform X2 [Bombyx mori]|uniref:Uncharacterized protein n=1 Tax=Bombyx mori TaxID=7091 RepID=A0A8R2M5I9_BOMMO|nr:uncharacterized protein LOC101739891 isoform X2 [Bombyx mori]
MVRKTSEYIWWMYFLFVLTIASSIKTTHGCQMDGVIMWPIPVSESILDTHTGYVLDRGTTDIEDITTIRYGEGLNAGPYLEVSHAQNRFQMWVNDAYRNYEENEVAQSMSMTVTFRCTGGTTNTLVFLINVIDTNNNAPQFRPNDIFEYVITTPLAPGFLVTGCFNNIVVRDIDLTTQRIDFGIEENPYIDIAYDSSLSTTPKEFKAVLRTKTFIRTIPELLTLKISATDVDLTGDPPRTTYATVHIKSDPEFEFPEEPVFSRAFYLANYDEGKITHDAISLRQGFDDQVQFSLDGDYATNFQLNQNGNQITLTVRTPLSNIDVSQILLIVKAEREYTSGASATVIVQLPEEVNLEFERAHYSGQIENNILRLSQLTLIQGFEGSISARIIGEHASYFSVTVQGNSVTITMAPLTENIIRDNNFIYLEVIVSAERGLGSAVVTLEIIKDDNTTPVFSSKIYTGNYDVVNGLNIEPIYFVQGYDDSVSLKLDGDSSELFEVERDGAIIKITSSALPVEIHSRSNLILSLEATKPRTVGANAAIVINLPEEPSDGMSLLGFERVTYVGSIEDNTVALGSIALTEGFSTSVSFTLFGELVDFFTVTASGSTVTVGLHRTIPEDLIPANRVIVLELRASAPQAVSAYTTIVLTIARDEDSAAPVNDLVFASPHYTGSYSEMSGLVFETPISLSQGYDTAVQFSLEGDNAQWFSLIQNQNSVSLTLRTPIPTAVIANNRKLIFSVAAQRPGSITIRTTIIISLIDEPSDGMSLLGFERVTYVGSIEDNTVALDSIALTEGFSTSVSFTLFGELVDFFTVTASGSTLTIGLHRTIPKDLIPANRVIVLELRASAPQAVSAYTTIVLTIARDEDSAAPVNDLVFASPHYTGSYSEMSGLVFETPISLSQGYDTAVQFSLEGDNAQWFNLIQNQNSVSLTLRTPIPTAVIANNRKLIFSVAAQRPGSITIRTTIIISLIDEPSDGMSLLGFERVTYVGSIEDNTVALDSIALTEGFSTSVSFTLFGELVDFFTVTASGSTVTIELHRTIPEDLIPTNRVIVLELRASAPQAVSAYTTIVLTTARDEDSAAPVKDLVFDSPHYTGSYSEMSGLVFETPISLSQGYDTAVQFSLEGDNAQWFSLIQNQNSVSLTLRTPIPTAVIANNRKLIFSIAAQRPGSITIRTTIIISLIDEPSDGMSLLGFERVTYVGSIEDNTVALGSIALTEGFSTSVSFTLFGELVDFFTVTASGSTVTIGLHRTIPEDLIPTNRVIVLELRASAPQAVSAYTTIVLTIARDEDSTAPVNDLVFDSPHYTGSYTEINGLVFDTPISLSRGYDEMVIFYLEGDNTQWFNLVKKENIISLTLAIPIPSTVLANNRKLIFNIAAQRPGSVTARATIIILLLEGEEVPSNEYFDKVLYEGLIQGNIVRHEQINLFGFLGENIRLIGEYASLFGANVNNGVITIQLSGSIPVPTDVTLIALELHALRARSVLLLTVESTENPNPPLVVFGSSSYALRVEITRTGLIGRVHASADNGEAVTYSLRTENVHLVDRLSVNNDGELHLSAPASSGVYTFEVVATTVFTRASALAIVHLTVDAATICGDDLVMPPLLVIDRDEESPHRDLVALNPEKHEGCRYTLTNRWPVDQTWLYVDDTGLHTRAIDREHESIAFMKVSQVQVELILHCANDKVRSKRSIDQKTNSIADYGSKHWILTDSILYNSRRSFVNLIVNDINDNAPVFVGKENEPIAVGYPISDLEEVLLPRSLAELKASDADIGENAVLRYWSHEPAVVVSPTTGFVHVRSGARLHDNKEFTVHATDRNGEGLTGHIKLLVKLLNVNNIAVVTVQNSFLDDEIKIISQLSTGVGYEVKALRSDIISDAAQPSDDTRKERDAGVAGTTMQLYIYGLNERQPVSVKRLITDINNIAIIVDIVANAISLEDHLEGREICVIAERDTGLLIACILLSILLFIIIVVAVVWSILKRRKSPHYSQFSDKNSIASRTNSLGQLPKTEAEQKPRLYIEDLRKSERKLQEILDAPPLEEVKASTSTEKLSEPPTESIIDIPVMEPSLPIVIQSIDKLKDATDESDDDEFGENKKNRRKSVVTFNENVEKIIHVEDDDDSTSVPGQNR